MAKNTPQELFPTCKEILKSHGLWDTQLDKSPPNNPDQFMSFLAAHIQEKTVPPYISELARLEKALADLQAKKFTTPSRTEALSLNPTLEMIQLSWKGILGVITDKNKEPEPTPGDEFILLYIHPESQKCISAVATNNDLLALKTIGEDLNPQKIAHANNVAIGILDRAFEIGVYKGFILSPPSSITRPEKYFSHVPAYLQKHRSCEVFTLQWHITQACDLHCKHCYDRSSRESIDFDKALDVLDQLREFCLTRFVTGQVSFTGGNPLLYPRFFDLYQETAKRNLGIAILGNPTTKERLQELVDIQMPSFYQVSLEGLQQHNDLIRGKGHFVRTINFLKILKELGIYSMVMLTLTRDNRNQVLPLAEYVRDKCDLFTFNRLSTVGEGAQLKSTSSQTYFEFLEAYQKAASQNPIMALKDNLFNIIKHNKGEKLFGGCAGFGCGAAFNFVSLLPDGEVHACRKLPSFIGNINEQNLGEIYESTSAAKYRNGPKACQNCQLRIVCGGCLAVIQGAGLDVFKDRDPYCRYEEARYLES